MKLRIFALAFSVGFIFCFFAAAFFVFRFSGEKEPVPLPAEESSGTFFEKEKTVFLLAFEDKGAFGPFTLIAFDTENGRIPVFTFSEKAALDYGGIDISAGALFSSVSPEIFSGTVENNLGIELSGYFIWNRESAEKIIAKAGSFDYVLPEKVSYTGDGYSVNLVSGVQNMNGKKICDIFASPDFSEGERCDTVSRITAAFLNRRLKRFLPESSLYPVIFNYTKTDADAFDKEEFSALISVLVSSGESLSGHITNDTERDMNSGLLYFSDSTKKRIRKYFG